MGVGNVTLTFILLCVLCLQLATVPQQFVLHPPSFSSGEAQLRDFSRTPRPPILASTAVLATAPTARADSLVLVGDVLLARNVEVLVDRYGLEYPLQYFAPSEFSPSPLVVGNFEASVPETHAPTPAGSINFSVATSVLPVLSRGGFSLVSLANNHSLDAGESGIRHTRSALAVGGVNSFGTGKGVSDSSLFTATVDNVPIAIIGVNALEAIDASDLEKVFKKAKQESTVQIVYVHWGEEYALQQNVAQRLLAKEFIALGADIVIGHHPHVTQGIEIIDNVPVFYSLGNFLFDQYFSKDVQEGLALTVQFTPQPQVTLEPFTSVHALSQPRPMDDADRLTFLSAIAARSDDELASYIMNAELPLRALFASSTKMAIINQ